MSTKQSSLFLEKTMNGILDLLAPYSTQIWWFLGLLLALKLLKGLIWWAALGAVVVAFIHFAPV